VGTARLTECSALSPSEGSNKKHRGSAASLCEFGFDLSNIALQPGRKRELHHPADTYPGVQLRAHVGGELQDQGKLDRRGPAADPNPILCEFILSLPAIGESASTAEHQKRVAGFVSDCPAQDVMLPARKSAHKW